MEGKLVGVLTSCSLSFNHNFGISFHQAVGIDRGSIIRNQHYMPVDHEFKVILGYMEPGRKEGGTGTGRKRMKGGKEGGREGIKGERDEGEREVG